LTADYMYLIEAKVILCFTDKDIKSKTY